MYPGTVVDFFLDYFYLVLDTIIGLSGVFSVVHSINSTKTNQMSDFFNCIMVKKGGTTSPSVIARLCVVNGGGGACVPLKNASDGSYIEGVGPTINYAVGRLVKDNPRNEFFAECAEMHARTGDTPVAIEELGLWVCRTSGILVLDDLRTKWQDIQLVPA